MRRFFWPVTVLLTSQLGRCPTCMRISFRAALLSWIGAAIVFITTHQPAIDLAALLVTAGFTGLWLAHVSAFSLRAAAARKARRTPAHEAIAQQALERRRRFLVDFAQAFLFAALATIIPVSAARAQQECNCYTDNDCPCPQDAPNCFFNPSRQVGYCCATSVGCGNGDGEWCCPRQCGGDTGTCLG